MENKRSFKQYALNPWMLDVITNLGFKEPTPIQTKVIPEALKHKNIIGQSETGSGKTHSYLIPLINNINESKKEVQIVVTAPTRELAAQIYEEIKKIIFLADKEQVWVPKLLIGGTDKKRVVGKMKEQPHIVVGTPGRLLSMIKEGSLDIFKSKSFVIDEADLMLDLGLIQEVDEMLVRTNPNLQLLVFSATIPEKLQPFLKKYLSNPTFFQMNDQLAPEKMEHRLIPLKHRDKASVIKKISTVIQPYLAIIFTNGKEQADTLARELTEKGMDVGLIHGGLDQRERKRVLKDIQQLKYQYIVATDLAARGIDIKGVSHVINAELPREDDFYVHRVGRTARAGMEGMAINLYTEEDLPLVKQLEKKGLNFEFYDIVKGEWQEVKAWNERTKRKRAETDIEKDAWKKVKRPKKVKPGYKRKMKYEQAKAKKKIIKKSFNKR
ncbi:DEAD/DEAH box helicase [Saliterribacillus persicus]|uniref:ATP-dependent RNA helicase CshB n=1 Tax=Saliterribacillus persicus TaxID=930114 RepID=A0A368XBM0_9BACI|nr:DEAD/DEAH box helicase [Saliterribacillus persicus]RCW65350.1 ATP-dependent RNA helicase CshB [Saliterribacillus persicus]